MSPRIAVVGGGVAGISCACELAEKGIPVTLFEARATLGGRVSSFRDPETGILVDNCQHVLLGCCSEAKRFLRRIGSLDKVRFHDKLNVIAPDGRLTIRSSLLPAPFHLLPSIMGSEYLSHRQKRELVKALGWMLVNTPGEEETAVGYLKSLGCSEELLERLIDPVVISALNEPAAEASAGYARMVMLESLVKGRSNYRLGVPNVPQSELIGEPATRWLRDHGCELRTNTRVHRAAVADGLVRSMELDCGELSGFDAYVTAVPPAALQRMGLDTGKGLCLRWKPIVSAHLFFDSATPPFEPACVVGEPFGWVFSKRPEIGCVEAVASAAEGISRLPKGEVLALAVRAAAAVEPVLGSTLLKRGIVYRAQQATFATLDCDALRPRPRGSTRNLFLAGDWTDTRWPATIESAVRSGRAAAKEVMRTL